ncbi:PDGLE domain-containing protein [Candidatus Margulisiibacteriota bacterium]
MKKILLVIILIVISASFFASAHPDGLEWVAEKLGFIEAGAERTSVMTDYAVPFIAHEGISTSVAGILGILITLGLFWVGALVFRKIRVGGQ